MYKIDKKKLKEAIEKSDGTYTFVQKYMKMASPVTAKKYVHMYPELLEIFHQIQDNLVDEAQYVLYTNLRCKNEIVRQRAAEFVLKNMPRSNWKDNKDEDAQVQLIKLLERMMDNAEK